MSQLLLTKHFELEESSDENTVVFRKPLSKKNQSLPKKQREQIEEQMSKVSVHLFDEKDLDHLRKVEEEVSKRMSELQAQKIHKNFWDHFKEFLAK